MENQTERMEELEESIQHGIYVSNMAYLLSKELGLPKHQCQELAIAGLLHDIGKIRASRRMVIEETKHNFIVKEMNYLRLHPYLGFEILRDAQYSEFIQESVLFHHENYDGSGYPSNLSENLIPIGARILRICDVFIALVSERTYRCAYDVDAAIEIMIGQIKNFDVKIFMKFMNLLHEIDLDKDIKKLLKGDYYGT